MRKGESIHNEQFLLSPLCFLPIWRTSCHFQQIWNCHVQSLWVWESLISDVWERWPKQDVFVKPECPCHGHFFENCNLDIWLWPWQITLTLVLKNGLYPKEYIHVTHLFHVYCTPIKDRNCYIQMTLTLVLKKGFYPKEYINVSHLFHIYCILIKDRNCFQFGQVLHFVIW